MEKCDALIVGGGPAGSSCAWKLCQAGWDVLLLDKKSFPRDKPCAGWITPQVVEALQLDAEQYADRGQRVWQPITGFRSGLIDGGEIPISYGKTISYGIRRCQFDCYLLERSGARCRLNEPVAQIQRRPAGWLVNGRFQAPVIIGAGGHFCPVARLLGGRGIPGSSVVVAQEVEFRATPQQLRQVRVDGEMPELFFCADLRGYGWCFRKGDFLNIGLGRIEANRLASHVAHFCSFLRQRGKVCCQIPTRFAGHAYQLYEHSAPKLIDDGALLIGDAAGLAYPQSGEGIRPAVESGLIAADVLLKAAGRYRVEELDPYRQRIEARFGKPRGRSATDWLPSAWLHCLASRLLATQWFARHVVMDRWFLHSAQNTLSL